MKNSNTIQPEVLYPYNLIIKRNHFVAEHVIPCSIMYNQHETACLFIILPKKHMDHFNISHENQPEPSLRFRMMNDKHGTHVFELWLEFEEDKNLRLFFNPHDPKVIKWLGIGNKNNQIALVFYNRKTALFSTIITSLDKEDSEWFERNSELTSKLKPNKEGYLILFDWLCKDIPKKHIVYHYFMTGENDYFIQKDGKVLEPDEFLSSC